VGDPLWQHHRGQGLRKPLSASSQQHPRRLATDADQSRSCAADALPPPAQGHSGVRRTRRQAIGLLADRGHRWANLVSPRCRPPHGVDRKRLTYESRSTTSSALSHGPRPSGVRAEIRLPSTRRVVDPVGASVLHISSRSKAGRPTVIVHTSTSDPAFHVSVLVERVLSRVGTTIAVLLQRQRGTGGRSRGRTCDLSLVSSYASSAVLTGGFPRNG